MMLKTVIVSELKNMLRDRLYFFFAVYPVILGVAGYYIVDWLRGEPNVEPWPDIVAMFLILLTGFIFGALIAFTLLDDKDDNVLMSLKITPVSVKAYVIVKLVIAFLFGFVASIAIIYGTGFLEGVSFGVVLIIAVLGAIQGPTIALIVNSFSDNKVEGFVIMKLSGLLLMFPAVAYFITGFVQYLLGIAPGFWAARIIEIEIGVDNVGNTILIFVFGLLYNILVSWLFMKLYTKKANI